MFAYGMALLALSAYAHALVMPAVLVALALAWIHRPRRRPRR